MMTWLGRIGPTKAVTMPVLAAMLVGSAQVAFTSPAIAQTSLAEARLRKIEAEIRAIQRQVFPGGAGDGRVFQPEITPGQPAPGPGLPATTPVSDLLTRMDSVETQLARMTAQIEQTSNRLTQLEARLAASADTPPAPGAVIPAAPDANLSAMSGGVSTPPPAVAAAAPAGASAPAPAPAAGPSPQRVAAVRAIEKPATGDAGDDEYSYGFRLWDAKFFPEAQQQLKIFVDRYPRHSRISFGRNLLGRAFLDDGKPREAATWFLQNYQGDKRGARAPDSLLYLAESMRQLKDTSRACIALAEFSESYAAEAAGRLKSQYDATRNGLKCTS
jgi:TolA-binding protein